jgi:hypothetical protein
VVSSGLWIILLEAGVALALLVFIVWWTLPKKAKDGRRDAGESWAGAAPLSASAEHAEPTA